MINSVTGNSDLDSPKQMQMRVKGFPSLFLDQTEIFWGDRSPLLSQVLDPALQNMCTDKTAVNFGVEL